MSNMTEAAKADLRAKGFRVIRVFRGAAGSGKSRGAAETAARLRDKGKRAIIEDECEDGAVRVWAQ